MDPAEIIFLVAMGVGAAVGSFVMVIRKFRKPSEAPTAPPPHSLEARIARLENQVEQHLERHKDTDAGQATLQAELRALENRLTVLSVEALSVEEFTAYTNIDGERRERMADKIGELRGKVAAALEAMRK